MENYKWLIVCVVCFLLGFGICYLTQSGNRQDGDRAIEQAQNMASLVAGLGSTLEEFRAYRDRTDDFIAYIEANNLELGNLLTGLRADTAELAIRHRELENRINELGIELPGIGADVSGVADDIGRVISDAEENESAAGD